MHLPETVLHLRRETPQDREFLARLYRSTRDDLPLLPAAILENLLAMQFHAQQAGHRQQYPDAEFCIIETNREPSGCIAVHRGAEEIRLVNLALLPEVRNRGHGRSLVRSLQAEADAAGKRLTLSVSSQNAGAQRLYAALGFDIVNDSVTYREMVWLPQHPS
ncbi:MAG TPA: GNAT family N-acetyltransferase [Gallionella sp.]|nr:GNAT family N-acetyltransferase [Gallionella sp.]